MRFTNSFANGTALLALALVSLGAGPSATSLKGVITSVANNKACFSLTDKSGAQTVVIVNALTKYTLGSTDSSFEDAIALGDKITAHVDPGGVAIDVINKNKPSKLAPSQMKQFLEVSDQEWAVLAPAIQRVQMLLRERTGNSSPGGGKSPTEQAADDLHRTMRNPDSTTAEISEKLRTLRDARTQVDSRLSTAQQELTALLTVRQEAILVQLGILQ